MAGLKRGDDGCADLGCIDEAAAGSVGEDVTRAQAITDDFFDGVFDGERLIFQPQGKAQQEGCGEDLGDGIGNAFSGDVRGSAAAGLEEAEVEAVTFWLAEAGAGEHAEATGDHGHLVAEDVAKEVFSDEHVETARSLDELHGGIVHVEVGERDIGVFLGDLDHRLTPQDGVGEHVGLVHAGDVFATELGGFEGDVGDAHDLALFINHGVNDLDVAIRKGGAALGLAEIETPCQLAHAEHIEAAFDEVRPHGAGGGEGRVANARAEVCKKAEVLADGQQSAALGLLIGRQVLPFRATYGAEEDGIARLAGGDGLSGQGLAGGVNGGTADELVGVFKLNA